VGNSQTVAVLTHHNDNARTGQNTNETVLTPGNVNSNSFGRLFTYPVDGSVYAQPLVLPNVGIPGQGTHNVVFVATEHDSVYAFDAGGNSETNVFDVDPTAVYVDSVVGSDTNSGAYNAPVRTLARVAGMNPTGRTIYGKRGSVFREQWQLPANATIRAYGTGPKPSVNGSDIVSNALFTPVPGLTNTYEALVVPGITTNLAIGGGLVNSNVLAVWENSVRIGVACFELTTTNAALVEQTPGSWWYDKLSQIFYLHTPDGSNPATNGRLYEVSTRTLAIWGNTGTYMENWTGEKAGAENGTGGQGYGILGLADGYFKWCVGQHCWNHCLGVANNIQAAPLIFDSCLGYDGENVPNSEGGMAAFIGQKNYSGSVPSVVVFTNCSAIQPALSSSSGDLTVAFSVSASPSSNIVASVLGCFAANFYTGVKISSAIETVTGFTATNCYQTVSISNPATNYLELSGIAANGSFQGILLEATPNLSLSVANCQFLNCTIGMESYQSPNSPIGVTNCIFANIGQSNVAFYGNAIGTPQISSVGNSFVNFGNSGVYEDGGQTNIVLWSDYNNYFNCARIGYSDPGNTASLAAWIAQNPTFDSHSAVTNPGYASSLFAIAIAAPETAGDSITNVSYTNQTYNSGTGALWQTSFINPGGGVTTVPSSDVGDANIVPEIGITSTPVIDTNSGTIYVEAKTKEMVNGAATYVQRLHALDVGTGAEKFGGPVVIQATVSGSGDNSVAGEVAFNPLSQLNQSALLLANGSIYIAFASHDGAPPYHGWLLAYNAQTLQQVGVFNTTPNGSEGGIWMAGGGPAADAAGNIYFITGTGSFSTNYASSNNYSLADSFVKLSTTNGLALADYFTPYNEAFLNAHAESVGSSGVVLLPDLLGSAGHPHLLVGANLAGGIYLVDRDNMGHFSASSDSQIAQELPSYTILPDYSPPACFSNLLYYQGVDGNLTAFSISNGLINTPFVSESGTTCYYPGANPVISANGAGNAIAWALETDAYTNNGPAVLHAYNASKLPQELYNSRQVALRDNPGGAVKFTVPTVANGKVYVGEQFALSVYGTGSFTAIPQFSPMGGVVVFTNSIALTISDATAGATIYYTLDGSVPSTNSLIYAGPLVVTNTLAVNAMAVIPGLLPSAMEGPTLINAADGALVSGFLKQEMFPGVSWTQVESPGFVGKPSFVHYLAAFQTPSQQGTDYSERVSGYFVPPVTGNYVFFVASYAQSDLFLSTDNTPANKHLIAQETKSSKPLEWLDSTGGSVVASKRSDQFAGTTWPGGNTISLTAGTPYYIEGDHQEYVGIENFGATFKLAGSPDPADGTASTLTGGVIETYAFNNATIVITNPVQDMTGFAGGRATLKVGAASTYIGDTSGDPGPAISYQWQSAPAGSATFVNIAGATQSSYTATGLTLAESGTQYQVTLAIPEFSTVSSIATLTVTSGNIVPEPVLTYHKDNARTGQNTNEVLLTLADVNTNTFGLLFTQPVDGYVFAQPLLMTNVVIPGEGTHNVVFVATENDSVYAFDADNNSGANASALWHASFINPAQGVSAVPYTAVGEPVIQPLIGITGTPVIDPATGTLYVEAKTQEVTPGATNFVHRLHALDITTGEERTNSPVVISCTNYPGTGMPRFKDNDGAGHVAWNPLRQMNRPALLLDHGVVYVAIGSHDDNPPNHGWIFAYDPQTLQQIGVFNTSPNGSLSAIWMGGDGPAADAAGNVYFLTANGDFNTNYTNSASYSVGDSFVRLSTTNVTGPPYGSLALADYFAPDNQAALSVGDLDLGSGGMVLLPDAAGSAAHPHLIIGAGKEGTIFLVDRDNMGHFNAANDSQIVQELPGALGRIFATPAYFNNEVFYWGTSYLLEAFSIYNGVLSTNPVAQSSTSHSTYASATLVISANVTNDAIIWYQDNEATTTAGPAVLHAINATNLSQELYNSSQAGARDLPGAAVPFATPIVANGKVYVPGQYSLSAFGLGAFLVPPVVSPKGGPFTNSVTITLSDVSPGANIYYTLDGTTPTTNSILYAAPFLLTNSANVDVRAFAVGAVPSAMVEAAFVDSSAIGNGIGLTGDYYTNVSPAKAFSFTAPPALSRVDPTIDFDWAFGPYGTFAAGYPSTNYSVRWTGMVQPQYTENYTFEALMDDEVRLFINGQKLIDAETYGAEGPTEWTATIPLQAQQKYNIEVDHYQYEDVAVAELSWSSPSTPKAIIPESQLYAMTNPPPAVVVVAPTNGSSFTGSASVTVSVNADDQYNSIASVSFYTNGGFLGAITNGPPYTLTVNGLTAGSYAFTAAASDTTGLTNTSAPVVISVTGGSGLPYGLTTHGTLAPFLNQNMPGSFNGSFPGSIPLLLSETGAYADTPGRIAASGLIPYVPNTPLWSDGAAKSRYLALPNNGGVITPSEQIGFASTGQWTFPSGTVFVKNFDLVVNATNPSVPLRRLETRLLVRDTNGAVYGVTYKWRADNSDADLLTGSMTEAILVTNGAGVVTQDWYYPSPADCLTCHTPVAGYVLGVNSRQLNGANTYPATGVTDNQLRAMNRLGLFNPAFNEAAIATYEYLSSVTNPAAPLVQRARSYLDANCAQCHQPGGTGPTFDARYDTPLASQNIINTPAVKGNLGYDNVDIVTPDDVWRSSLYLRMDTTNSTIKMPPLARNLIDTNAAPVLAAWINSLPGTPAEAPPTISPAGGTFTGGVTVTLEPPDANATVYYTLDGSPPTTNSLPYTGPFNLTNTATVSANAFETSLVNSVAPSDLFTILPGVLFTSAGSFTNGMFTLQLSGAPGQPFVIQTSTNLVNWIPLLTNLPAASPFSVTDAGASNNPTRFYRAIQK
jgi:mono/diheme cytochrome c family protein